MRCGLGLSPEAAIPLPSVTFASNFTGLYSTSLDWIAVAAIDRLIDLSEDSFLSALPSLRSTVAVATKSQQQMQHSSTNTIVLILQQNFWKEITPRGGGGFGSKFYILLSELRITVFASRE